MPTFSPPVFSGSAGLKPTASATVSPARQIYDAQDELLRRKRALLDTSNPANPTRAANTAAGRGVLELSNPANPVRRATLDSRRALIDVTGRQNQQQRNYYQTESGFQTQRTAETQQLIDARKDVPDLAAVAQAQGHRRAVNALRDAVGIPRDIEIDTPQGDQTALPVGVSRSLRPNAAYVAENIADKEAGRENTMKALRNSLNLTGADVADVRNAGQAADLNFDTASLGASYLDRLTAEDLKDLTDLASYNQGVAGADLSGLQLGEFGKELYIDPYDPEASRYVTPAEKDRLDYDYQTKQNFERIPTQYGLQQQRETYTTQQDAGGSTLAAQTPAQLLEQYNNSAISAPGNLSPAAIKAELVRRYRQRGFTQAAAETAAQQVINEELAKRYEAEQRKKDSTPELEVGPDGKLRIKPKP